MLVRHKPFLLLVLQLQQLLVLALKLVMVLLTGIIYHGLILVLQALLVVQAQPVLLALQARLVRLVLLPTLVRLDRPVPLVLVELDPPDQLGLQVQHQQ
jgi:hypothetical protein